MPDPVADFLETTQPQERTCRVCGDTYTGLREVCEKRSCFYGLLLQVEEGRRLMGRTFDYVSTARKTFLVETTPEDGSGVE